MRPSHGAASSLPAAAASRLRTVPSRRDWIEALGALAVLALFAAALGRWSDVFVFDPSLPGLAADPAGFLALALVAVIVPALGEELVFRGAFQPVRLRGLGDCMGSAASLCLFVLWHPLQVRLGFPAAQPVFLDPGFLAAAGLLGALCTLLVHRSGSLWTAVFVHWAVVVIWKAGTD